MSQGNLHFSWSASGILLSLAVVLIASILAWLAFRRSGYRRSVLLVELLRVAVVCLAVCLLNQPEWIETYRPREKPILQVLVDASQSMQTQDGLREPLAGNNSSATRVTSRAQLVAPILDAKTWSGLEDRFEVVIELFGTDSKLQGTDLFQTLNATRAVDPAPRAVVLASDGDWNSGMPPVQEALKYRMQNIPIFSVIAGREQRLPDVELVSFDVPTFGVEGKAVRIPFTIESSLPQNQIATVRLASSDGQILSQEVEIAAMGRTTDAILWSPEAQGEFALTLTLPEFPGELIEDNNELQASIRIAEERLKVLVIESIPRWEYRFLRNALSRDSGVEVSCLLLHPGLSKRGGGNPDYISEFPDGLDELAKFDVVFLGDVGVGVNQLSREQCKLLKGLVERQASGLVFIPGWQGNQMSLLETELADLYPVTVDRGVPEGIGIRTPGHFELTEFGRESLLTRLGDTQDQNSAIWENLPGFQWYAAVVKSKPGTDVLAVHSSDSNQHGRLPLLATKKFGNGKVLFMGTDGAWRWRKGVEDLYHYRFWGQVVRWMAYQRNMAKGKSMRLYYSPDQPSTRQVLTLNANVMQANGEPLPKGEVTARIEPPSGRAETIRFDSVGSDWGAFASQFTPSETGKHRILLRCRETNTTLEASFDVRGNAVEVVGRPARPQVLEELSRVSNGQLVQAHEVQDILVRLQQLPEPPPKVRRRQLWCHPALLGLWLVLLSAFWIGRKMTGMI